MIPSKTILPTITPPGKYAQLVELIMTTADFEEVAAERFADRLLDRLGLYGPIPERMDDLCSAMFFNADPEDGYGWVQCSKEPGHARHGDPLHADGWSGASWTDDNRQAVAADDGGD